MAKQNLFKKIDNKQIKIEMSYKITFPSLTFLHQQANPNQKTQLFQILIYNEQWKQDMKVHFNNSIDHAQIQLPKNLFVLNIGDHFSVQIQEKAVSKIDELDNKLEIGEFRVLIDGLGIREANEKVKQGQICFQTESKVYKVALQFKAIYQENKVFSGYFCGLLKNQGYQPLSLQSMKNAEIIHNLTNQYSLKQPEQQVQKKAQVPRQSAVWTIKNPLICCTQPTQDEQQVADEQLPQHISQKLSRKLITPKSRSQIQEVIPISEYKNQTAQTTQTKSESAFRPKQIEMENKNNINQDRVVQLYRGSCKTKNCFSCGDEDYDGQEICILQPVYRNKN